MGRCEEMQPNQPRRIHQARGHLIHIQVRCIGGQHRIRWKDGFQFGQNIVFHRHIFKGRLNRHLRSGRLSILRAERHPAAMIRSPNRINHAALQTGRNNFFDIVFSALQSSSICLQNRDMQARCQKRIGDPRTHRAAANHHRVLHLRRSRAFEWLRRFRSPLRKENMSQRLGLRPSF